jgi:predicted kinase
MKKGRIIMICGLPGSGKTTLSKELSKKLKAVRLCPDEWIHELNLNSNKVGNDSRDLVEALQISLAENIALKRCNVILENGFWSKAERLEYLTRLKAKSITVDLIFMDLGYEELVKRLTLRNKNLPKNTYKVNIEDFDRWFNKFERPNEKELKMYNKYKIYK